MLGRMGSYHTLAMLALIVTLSGAAQPSQAAITYLTQARSVRANGFLNGDFEGAPTFNALDFGVFNRTSSWTFSGGRGTAQASQLSRLLPERIEVSAFAEVAPTGLPGLEGLARSSFDVSFVLSDFTTYSLQQSHTSPGVPGPVRSVQATLIGPSGTVFAWLEDGLTSNWPTIPLTGVLPSGQYSLFVDCRIQTGGGVFQPIIGGATLTLNIPSPTIGLIAAQFFLLLGVPRQRRCQV